MTPYHPDAGPTPTAPISVFVSYSHKDRAEKNQLLRHLHVLETNCNVRIWNDDAISVGTDWESEILQAIAEAHIAIILVTVDFLNSEFIQRVEKPRLLDRARRGELKLVPVYAKDCLWEEVDWLKRMQLWPRGRPVWRSDCTAESTLVKLASIIADLAQQMCAQSETQNPDAQPGPNAAPPQPAELAEPDCIRIEQSPVTTTAFETILVQAGEFWMGSAEDDPEARPNEQPRHKVYLPHYKISRYPITNAQYQAFIQDFNYTPPSHWPEGQVPPGKGDHPVVCVGLEDAQNYCHWLGRKTGDIYRLPTEAEWEKAARGALPDTRRYPWGNEWHQDCCNTIEAGHHGTTPVYLYQDANTSPCGAVDLAGNVWEWTSSIYQYYRDASKMSISYLGPRYVVRGGAWSIPSSLARVSCRGRYAPQRKEPYLGFRLVLEMN